MNSTVLRDKRQALLDRMLHVNVPGTPPLRPIAKRPPGKPVPLSYSQERLWFLDQLAGGSQFYVESSAIRLSFDLKPDALEQAINAVVSRHEVLRMHVEMRDGQPVQVASASVHVPLTLTDLSGLPPFEGDQELERLAVEHAMRPFDLRIAPLIRTSVVKRGPSDWVFLLAIHHIVSDGWSMSIFNREVSEHYAATAAGRRLTFPPLAVQYFDYAAWQRESDDEESLASQVSFWRARLSDLPQIELPLDRPRPNVLTYAGSHLDVRLPANLSAGLRALSRREQSTMFMTTLALFGAVISVHTGQTDLPIGTPVAGRNRTELEPLVGVFLNTLVLRLDLSGDPSFRELLRRVKQEALAAFDHQDVPFERLVEELQPERDLGKNPLFQVLFQFFTPPNEKAGAAAMQPSTVPVDRGTAILDAAWHLFDTPEGIRGRIEYSTELFDLATIERHFQQFTHLAAEVIAHPERPLSDLQVIPPEERRQLLTEWQGVTRAWPVQGSIHERYEDRVAQTPGAVAVIEGARRSTYSELNQRANRIANHLRKLGVTIGSRVAICLERSAEMIAAALGVLKAGAAYVPLDPAYPVSRLVYILENSRAAVLISDAERIPSGSVPLLRIDAEGFAEPGTDAVSVTAHPGAAAYVIYTSGSTGRPKGVIGLHGATMNRLEWMWEEFPFQPGEVACQRTALSFVDSVWEMFGPLLAGVPLVVVPEAAGRDVRALVGLLAEHRITRLLTVPSLLQSILESEAEVGIALPRLRLWFTSGERLSRDLAVRFRRALPDRELVNLYGSSEVAGDILYERLAPGSPDELVTIGRPIANSRAYVLDGRLQPVPRGLSGELHVAGPNLARGYLEQPALTAERFLPDPFSPQPGGRMYATGDRARHRPDGRIEFLGRADQQVKLRGFRIELEEVEAALREHTGVRDAAVAVQDDSAGGRLVAWVVRNGDGPSVEELRIFTSSILPGYMVPNAVVWVDALPRTPNGKLNRSALSNTTATAATHDFLAPQSDAEQAVASIWADLLGLARVGGHDNFFDIGGHSLVAVRLVSRLRDDLGVELPLRDVFLHPTLSALASLLEEKLLEQIEPLSENEARLRLNAPPE